MYGAAIKTGDTITFCFGIPIVSAKGVVFSKNGRRFVKVEKYKPTEILLSELFNMYEFEVQS